MPRKKPTTRIGVYGQFDINPEKAVEMYIDSKKQNKNYIKEPYWDVPREGLELTAIQAERDHIDFKKQQEQMRIEAITQGKFNEKRIKQMRKTQEQLRERFIDVNDFIKDCETKEITADKKTTEEKETQEKIRNDIDKLTHDLDVLTEFEGTLTQAVNQLKPYEDVIENVVEESSFFSSVKDLMDSVDALMIAQVEMTELEQEKIKGIEQMRLEMIKATNEAALTAMGLNNELADLEKHYNEAADKAIKWENILEKTKNFITEQELTTYRLNDSIYQLYNLLLARNEGDNKIKSNDYEAMLDYIKTEMEILEEVVRLSKSRLDQKSLKAEKGSKKAVKENNTLKK